MDLFERRGPLGSWPRTSACYCMFWRLPPPRSELVRLERSPQLRAEDDEDERTWSTPCLYVERAGWRTGVGTALLAAAVERAVAHGAQTVEGYPVKAPSVDPYTGYDTMFARAGSA